MINLYLERPPGARTIDTEFLPREGVRFAGEVEGLFGLPEIGVGVTTILRNYLGQEVARWNTRTNIWGNYYADFNMPAAEGSYSLQSEWDPLIGAKEFSGLISFSVTLTPSPIGPVVNFDCSPLAVQPNGQVKVTAVVYVDGYPRAGASVNFAAWDPANAIRLNIFKLTDDRGATYTLFNADMLGDWLVLAQVLSIPGVEPYPGAWQVWYVNVDPKNAPAGPTPPPGAVEWGKWLLPIGLGLGAAAVVVMAGRRGGPRPGR